MARKWEKYKLKIILAGKSEVKLPTGSHSCRQGNITKV
jgi:hypothetical protein